MLLRCSLKTFHAVTNKEIKEGALEFIVEMFSKLF